MEAYGRLFSAMLSQKIGALYAEDSRNEANNTLHPSLSHLGDMLDFMGQFFMSSVVVWQRYDASPYYAHVMTKGLLLVEILRLRDTDGIPLDTSEPRPIIDLSPPPKKSILMESSSGDSSRHSDSGAKDIELMWRCKRNLEPPRERRRLEESTETCRTFRICSESSAEFAELV